jgi:hypothetical protein
MAAALGVSGGHRERCEGLDDVPGGVDVGGMVGGADAGDGFAGGLGEVGEPVGAGSG